MNNNFFERFGPFLVVVPFSTAIFGFYGTIPEFGPLGIIGFAFIGFLWAMFLGFIAKRLMRQEAQREWFANTPVFPSIMALGLMSGAGIMYMLMMNAALSVPSTTYAILSALMKPAVSYYIVINSLMELLIVPFAVFLNWDATPKRRMFFIIGVVLYFAIRVWTHLVYAETRLEISERALTAADVEWFKRTLATDYRVVLEVVSQGFFILAAFVPYSPITRKVKW
jgi:large-conductance mechanosensitive channel